MRVCLYLEGERERGDAEGQTDWLTDTTKGINVHTLTGTYTHDFLNICVENIYIYIYIYIYILSFNFNYKD